MDAIELLEKQHREVEALFDAYLLASQSGDPARKRAVFHRLAGHIALHSTLEEQVFYPSVLVQETEGALRQALHEHLEVKRLIAELLDLDATEPVFDEKMDALAVHVRGHIEEEERRLFSEVRETFLDEELRLLAVQLRASLAELEADELHEPLPAAGATFEVPAANAYLQ